MTNKERPIGVMSRSEQNKDNIVYIGKITKCHLHTMINKFLQNQWRFKFLQGILIISE